MFVPPYKALLGALGITAEQLDKQAEVTVSAKSLKLLIKAAVFGSEVDETGYLSANPDVRDALAKRTITSARQHYIAYGYYESRQGGVRVDVDWYLKANPDVAAAIRAGKVTSASEHYYSSGAREFRAPNAAALDGCGKWKASINKAP